LEQKLAVINALETDRLFPVRMLDQINMILPSKDAWLERITQRKKELVIEGTARDNGVIARLMKDLEQADFVESVELVFSREKEIVGVKLQQFTLNCVIKKGI